tara:strand:- start:1275 stop:1916 length:642 start_codon:yes stop_codon:yes gene_type:complete
MPAKTATNVINSGTIDTLQSKNCLLLEAIKTKNPNKVQLHFAEKKGANTNSLLAMFNASDDRFSSKATRAWISVEIEDAKRLLGVDLSATSDNWQEIDGKERMPLNILNPTVLSNGKLIRVKVIETVTPTEFEKTDPEKYAKRAGKDGDFITHNGDYIFMHKEIIMVEPSNAMQENATDDVILPTDNAESKTQANSGVKADNVTVAQTEQSAF